MVTIFSDGWYFPVQNYQKNIYISNIINLKDRTKNKFVPINFVSKPLHRNHVTLSNQSILQNKTEKNNSSKKKQKTNWT